MKNQIHFGTGFIKLPVLDLFRFPECMIAIVKGMTEGNTSLFLTHLEST